MEHPRSMGRATLEGIGALLLFVGLGAGEGWLLGRFVGPPTGSGAAALHGLAAGSLLGLFVLATLRSAKGVEMLISTLVAGPVVAMIAFGLLRKFAPGWHPTIGGGGGLVRLYGGMGLLFGLMVMGGILVTADEALRQAQKRKERGW